MTSVKNITNMPNVKGINFEMWGGLSGFLDATSGGQSSSLRRILPWLAKAISMTANAVADLPFDIMRGETIIDTSADWQNKLGGLGSPQRLINKIAGSLCGGEAYIIPTVTGKTIVDLQYCAPQYVQPHITRDGLQWLDRASEQGQTGKFSPAPDEAFDGAMMYFWLPDSDIEIGPAKCHPLGTAALASGLLVAMDGTLKKYGESGFIPPTLLAAKGMVSQGDRDKTETWWNSFLRRWDKNVAKIVNADAIDVKRVGAGMDELNGVYKDLTRQQIENIGAAFGIPSALFMSDMAFASEFNAMVRFWYSTSQFISIYHTIEETFTEQLLDNWGMKWIFRPETIDAFQVDEASRAMAYTTYVGAGMRPSITAQMLGLELPAGVEYTELDEKYDKGLVEAQDNLNNPPNNPQQPFSAQDQQAGVPADEQAQETEKQQEKSVDLDAKMIKDLDLWRQMAVRFYKKGKALPFDFECKALPESIASGIRTRLREATDEAGIEQAFKTLASTDVRAGIFSADELDVLREAIKALEKYE